MGISGRLSPRCIAVFVALLLSVTLAPPALASSRCEAAGVTPAKVEARSTIRATLCMINSERAKYGVAPLRLNRLLSKAARRHASDMDRRNYFSHDSLDGGSFVDRIRRAGYMNGAGSWTVGENLAWGTQGRSSPRGVTAMWMNSPGHRANILNPSFREIGIGISYGAPVAGQPTPAATYDTSFGTRG
jgi:uncharacterized protein YkwD